MIFLSEKKEKVATEKSRFLYEIPSHSLTFTQLILSSFIIIGSLQSTKTKNVLIWCIKKKHVKSSVEPQFFHIFYKKVYQ